MTIDGNAKTNLPTNEKKNVPVATENIAKLSLLSASI